MPKFTLWNDEDGTPRLRLAPEVEQAAADPAPAPAAPPAAPDLTAYLTKRLAELRYPEGLGLEGLKAAQVADQQRNGMFALGQIGERAAAQMQNRAPNLEGLTPDGLNVHNYLQQRGLAQEDYQRQLAQVTQPLAMRKTAAEVAKSENEAQRVASLLPFEQAEKAAGARAHIAGADKAGYETLLLKIANDPNNPQAQAARALLNQYVPGGVDPRMNLATAEKLFGPASNVEAGRMRLRADAINATRDRIEPTSAPGLKPFNDNLNSIANIKSALKNPDGSWRDMTKAEWEEAVATHLAVLKNGGASTEEERKAVMPPGGAWATAQEWMNQKPHGLGKVEWEKRMWESLERLEELNRERLRTAQRRVLNAAPVLTADDKKRLAGNIGLDDAGSPDAPALQPGEILIRRNGRLGAIPENEFNPETDERL